MGFKPSNYKFQPLERVRREKLPSWESPVRKPEEEEGHRYVPVARRGWPWWKVPVVDATTPPALRPRKANRILPALGLLLWFMLFALLAILLLTETEDDTLDPQTEDRYERLKAR